MWVQFPPGPPRREMLIKPTRKKEIMSKKKFMSADFKIGEKAPQGPARVTFLVFTDEEQQRMNCMQLGLNVKRKTSK